MILKKNAQNVFKLATRRMETTSLVREKVLFGAGAMTLLIGLRERRIAYGISVVHLRITVSFNLGNLLSIELTLC